MTPMKRLWRVIGAASLILCIAATSPAQAQEKLHPLTMNSKADGQQDDPRVFGQPLSYWIDIIRDREIDNVDRAFDAIVALGPAAGKAVPELTKILASPFVPVRLGRDSRKDILDKLVEIHLRAGAVDGLGAIGHAAAPAAEVLIQWGLTLRVLPPDVPIEEQPFYVELVGVDVLERMRVAGTVARLGSGAAPAVQRLIESRDNERQKLAVAILSDSAVAIATELMGSPICEDRILGVSLLSNMWPVVATENLTALQSLTLCDPANPDRSLSENLSGTSNSSKVTGSKNRIH